MNIESKLEEEIRKLRLPSIKHYEWEENGKKYSSWKIDTGSGILNCGDGGMKLFEEALKNKLNETI